ncbi:MAG: T9SS type A sorting domain-containing protein [Bacteroidota bacterium]
MKRKIYALLLLCAPLVSQAQKTNPAPYCASEYNNNYNMIQSISVGAYSHSFGPMGSIASGNTYLFVDTAKLPPISKSVNTSIFLDFYTVADVEPAYFGMWIDYDQSNSFEASELIFHNENTVHTKLPSGTASPMSIPITVLAPASAKPGKTRMRIVRSEKIADPTGPYDAAFRLDPCHTKTSAGNIFGCTYDFEVTVFGPSEIEEQLLRSQLRISPNPAADKISITNTSVQKMTEIVIFDFSGKKLFQAQSAEEINISQYASGVFFAKITMDNGIVVPMKFVKN